MLRPLFPGYVFVEIEVSRQRWQAILSTYGVRTLVRAGDEIGRLDPAFLDSLKAREVEGAIVKPASAYRVSDAVRFSSGPLEGIVARILEIGDRERLVVLLSLLNHTVKVKVNANQMAPA